MWHEPKVLNRHEQRQAIRKGLTEQQLEEYLHRAMRDGINFTVEVFSIAVAVVLFSDLKLQHDTAAEAIGRIDELFGELLEDSSELKTWKAVLEQDYNVHFEGTKY